MKSRLYKLVLFSAFLLSISLIYVNAFAKTSNKWNSADKKHIDKTITDFMTKNGLSGSSVAIVKEGRLVFSKGYGFITDSKSHDSIFVHINQIEEPVKQGYKVTFEIEMGPKGPNAVNVKIA